MIILSCINITSKDNFYYEITCSNVEENIKLMKTLTCSTYDKSIQQENAFFPVDVISFVGNKVTINVKKIN